MNQSVANLRRAAAVLAAFALLSGLTPALSRAQSDAKPSDATPTDTTATLAAPADTTAPAAAAATPAKPGRPPKVARVKPPQKSFEERKKEDGVHAGGSNWLSFRFGYAKRAGNESGQGLVGYGVGYQRMLTHKYAFAAGVGHDVVGHFGGQIDEAVPFTAEFQRHFNWKTAVRPFVGLGGGYYFRKNYRTGTNYETVTRGGPHVSLGFNSALDDKHVIGFETRVAYVGLEAGVTYDPLTAVSGQFPFGFQSGAETIYTAKVSWALVY